jgi:hypothetical protein
MKKLLLLALLPMCGWTANQSLSLLVKDLTGTLPLFPMESPGIVLSQSPGVGGPLGHIDDMSFTLRLRVQGQEVEMPGIAPGSLEALRCMLKQCPVVGLLVRDLLRNKYQIEVVSGNHSHVLASDDDLAEAVAAAPSGLAGKVLNCMMLKYELRVIMGGHHDFSSTLYTECMVDLAAFMDEVDVVSHGSEILGKYEVSLSPAGVLKTDADLKAALRDAPRTPGTVTKVVSCSAN